MTDNYVDLVRAYVQNGQESDLAAIAALREVLISDDLPIEDLVGMHEQALLTFKHDVTPQNFEDLVLKTSTCFIELTIAYSLADQKKKILRENELRVARERQRLEALGQMAGGVAHEFNNWLQPIMGMAELALEDAPADGELAERLHVILDCARQAAAIARGILITARKRGAAPAAAAFAPMLRGAVHFVAAILPREVRLDLAVSCGLEAVVCDEGELGQVLLNLARNASAAMGGAGTVRIALDRLERRQREEASGRFVAQECLRLSVADNGVGMTPDVAASAFQPFFTTKPPTEGTGLGLSVVMAIVDGWNGEIELETAPGAGTRISMIFPVVAAPEPRPAAQLSTPAQASI